MDFRLPEIKIVSPDRFCPDCRRPLFTNLNNEGGFELAENTRAFMSGTESYDDPFDIPDEIEAVPEVYCLKRMCRLKRFLRREKINFPPVEDELLLELRRFRISGYVLAASCALLAGALIFYSVVNLFSGS